MMMTEARQQLVGKYRPKAIADFIGLRRPKAILSAFAANPYESAWLFLGPSGLGKTTLAMAVAAEIGAEVHHIACKSCDLETVNKVCHGCYYAPMFGENWHCVIVDECDQMSHAAQLAFLSKLDATETPPRTFFIFTANDTALLKDRFLSRCRTVNFSTDGLEADLVEFLRDVYRAEAPGKAEPEYASIAAESGLNIRQALMNLELEIISAPAQPTTITAGELSRMLGVDASTLYKRVQMGLVPKPTGRPMRWDAGVIAPLLLNQGGIHAATATN